MSRSIGTIHHWLFNKIQLYEELEEKLYNTYRKRFGDLIPDILADKREIYGFPVRGKRLEEIIDEDNIHGWLQGKIAAAETRQAAFLAEVISNFDKRATDLAKEIYADHGQKCGKDAQLKKETDTAPQIYKALNDYILDGMPCDTANRVTVKEDDQIKWEEEKCLHLEHWQRTKADIDLLYQLRQIWIENFVQGANSNYKYYFSRDNDSFEHSITKKS
mgnify:FL=1